MPAPTDSRAARSELEALVERAAAGPVARLARLNRDYARSAARSGRQASVLMLFGEVEGEVSVLLTQRAATLRTHAGQVAFPGGSQDPADSGAVAAAVREAEEETGLLEEDYTVLGALDPVPVPISGFLVTPVLAWWDAPRLLAPVDPGETARVFTVPVRDLADASLRVTTELRRDSHVFRGPGFEVAETLVWGFTGYLVEALLEELGWSEPVAGSRTVDPRGY
ncbi:NUDIX hydrolase [Arthrobacter sp. UM1]|uniref:NUDIX hydrolase n=1 Tax=Arthrobacter sp. UM1 TaxID=2766776 RepID=UPI001CF62144|nr:CoA pyrophosphatase [Arthrobacter sp. UM1]MCB4208992.1 CoA pyrophosphatase [Arthrobacter sp. UM1]